MDWSCKIKKATNGYVVTYEEEDDDDRMVSRTEVFEEKDSVTEDGDKEALARVFHWLADYFGHGYNSWGKDNLKVSWNKEGRKVEK